MNEVEYIKSRLEKTERLLGLTEEALELALAALKLRRVLDGRNPTPVTEEQATANLLEEYGDVLNTVEVLVTPTQQELAVLSRMEKRTRWVERLKAADREPDAVEGGCKFCRTFDFGTVRCKMESYGPYLAMAGGSSRYPQEQQFKFCPVCGKRRYGGGAVTEPEEERGDTDGD